MQINIILKLLFFFANDFATVLKNLRDLSSLMLMTYLNDGARRLCKKKVDADD